MLQLNYTIIFPTIVSFISSLYVYTSHISTLVLFYPVGLVLTFYVLISIFFMIIKASIIVLTFIKTLLYLYYDLQNVFEGIIYYAKYINPTLYVLLENVRNFIMNYSIYILVFYAKRVEFYIFWLFVILVFC